MKKSNERIVREVARFAELPVSTVLGRTRTAKVSRVRQMAYYMVKRLTNQSVIEISRQFGRNHTTVLHGIKKVETRLDENPELWEQVDALLEKLNKRNEENHDS